jgi:cytochrome P450
VGLASTIFRVILHDPTTYPDPDAFKPERFLNTDGSVRDDSVLVSTFGFGRRICPGGHFVDSTMFIVVASLLSVFNIESGKGTDGGPNAYPYTGNGITYSQLMLSAYSKD